MIKSQIKEEKLRKQGEMLYERKVDFEKDVKFETLAYNKVTDVPPKGIILSWFFY